jgi:beta-lactamase regulating signal transducer with metallopeptidase domain
MSARDWSAGLTARLVDIPLSELVLLKLTVLLVVAWIAHRALVRANPRWRVLLWRGAAIAVLLGPVWMRFGPQMTLAIAEPRKSIESQSTAFPVRSNPISGSMVMEDADGAHITGSKSRSRRRSSNPATAETTAAISAKAGPELKTVAKADDQPTVATNRWASFWTALIRIVWLIGFVLVAVRTVIGHWRVGRLLSTASPAPDWILQICSRVIRELPCRSAVEVVVSSRAHVPFLCGLWRQRIVVPEKFCNRRFEDDLPAIFAHELAHAKSHDVWWNTVLRIEAAALWFHPLAWRIPHAHAASCEDVGDAVSATYVGDARFYSRVLARVALELLSRPAATAVAMARTAEISRRLDALERTVPHRSIPRWAHLSTAAACLAVVLGAASLRLAFAGPKPSPALIAAPAPNVPAKWTGSEGAANLADPTRHNSEILDRVFAAWKARQERFKTFHVTWKNRLLLSKGYLYEEFKWPIAGMDPDGERFKAADRFECQLPESQLWGDERGRLRDDLTVVRSHALKAPRPVVRVRTVVNGITHSRLVTPISDEAPLITMWREVPFPTNQDGGMYAPQAIERRNRETELMPLMLSLRPQSQAAGIVPRACRIVEENASIDNLNCIKIRMESSLPPIRRSRRDPLADNADTFWVDPDRDYVIVLWERNWNESQPGLPLTTVKIDYRRDDRFGWVPSHWESRFKKGLKGTESATLEASVTHTAINEPLPRDTFAHDAPPRTRVFDVTIDENLTAKLAEEAAKPAHLPDPSMNAIVAAWTRRQSRIRSFHAAWEKNWNYFYRYDDDRGMTHRPVIHPEFQKFRSNDSEWIDGPRLALEQIVRESPDHLNLMRTKKCAFDGESTRVYFREDIDDPGAAKVRKGLDPRNFRGSDGNPLLVALRTALPKYSGIEPSLFRVLPITAKIGDVDCTILHSKNEHGHHIFCWLDPARDYLLLREHTMLGGQDIAHIDYSYHSDARAGWVPDGWTNKMLSQYGCFVCAISSKVAQYAVNEPLPASTFQIKFPSGTRGFQDGSP